MFKKLRRQKEIKWRVAKRTGNHCHLYINLIASTFLSTCVKRCSVINALRNVPPLIPQLTSESKVLSFGDRTDLLLPYFRSCAG